MQSYIMRRYTLVAPHVRNDGSMSGYPAAVREALLAAGIDGWTEYETHGSWRGKREAGTTFELYRADEPGYQADSPNALRYSATTPLYAGESPATFVRLLGAIGRACMPDQEAVQVTRDAHTVTLWEA